jgi:hypothetical protein
MRQGLLDELVRGVQPYSEEVFDDRTSRFEHAFALGAQDDSEGADQRQSKGLSTPPSFQVIQDGATASGVRFCKSEDLRLSSAEIPGRQLRRNRDFRFNAYTRKSRNLSEHSLALWFRSNLSDDHIRHDKLVRELAEECDATNFAEQDKG